MKEVKTQKRYKCDFCKTRGIKRKLEFHEGICFRNPNRVCVACGNSKVLEVEVGLHPDTLGIITETRDCHFCAQFDEQILKEIKQRENSI